MPRDPYPFPTYENDTDFARTKDCEIIKHPRKTEPQNMTYITTDNDPWNRLYETQTLTSSRRQVFYQDPQAPQDNLDFVVKSKYNHHQEFLRSKAETLFQPETLGLNHGRVLKNRQGPQAPEIDLENLELRKSVDTKKGNINSINGAIASHHSAATNGGYSRKHDGGFYTC